MKLGDHVESVADGLNKIIESVQDSVKKMGMGFTFIALDQDWVPLGGKMTRVIEDLITIQEKQYEVPIVAKSGDQKCNGTLESVGVERFYVANIMVCKSSSTRGRSSRPNQRKRYPGLEGAISRQYLRQAK